MSIPELTAHNVRVPYDFPTRVYHRKVAALVTKYTPQNGTVLDIGAGAWHMLALFQQMRRDLRLFAADAYHECLRVVSSKVSIKKEWLLNEGHCFTLYRAHWCNFLEKIIKADVLEYSNDEVFLFKRKISTNSILKKIELVLSRFSPALSCSHIAVVQKLES